jgi:hypothetical protein
MANQDMVPEEERAHSSLWRNLGVLRGVLVDLAAESRREGDDQATLAYEFVAARAAEISDAPSWSELWDSLEAFYRGATAVAAAAMRDQQREAYMAFARSAHMLLRVLQPEWTEEQVGDQIEASLEKRSEELLEE